jgi:arylsulfatase A-like enzyme
MRPSLLLLFALLCVLCGQFSFAAQPNIVYFLIDDLGYADCGFNGSKDIRTPHIDKLAKAGAVLESFYVQPVCSPTRAALLTGRYPTGTGVYTIVRPGARWGLPLTERTLPQALKEAGYTTAIVGKWHLGEFQPEYLPRRRGFDRQYGHMFGALDYFTHLRDGKPDWYRDDQPIVEEGYTTELLAKEACRIIREKPAEKPLFLYVPFNGIHAPHQVPASYKEPYAALPEPRRTIAGMLAAVDEAIGQITAALEEKGLRQNTLIIFASDNGGPGPGRATMNTPLRAGKGTIYEGGVRACAFATWPGKIPDGITVKEPLHVVDWYPTLLKLAGAPPAQKLPVDGLDIWPVLTQGAKSPHDALLLHSTMPGRAAVRMGDWKLLLNASEQDAEEVAAAEPAESGKVELYNLAQDIAEKNNLAANQPEKVKELRARLNAFLKDAVEPGNPNARKAALKKANAK